MGISYWNKMAQGLTLYQFKTAGMGMNKYNNVRTETLYQDKNGRMTILCQYKIAIREILYNYKTSGMATI